MYEILSAWENIPGIERQPKYIRDYQTAWKKARKIVFSSSLKEVKTSNTILKSTFDRAEIEGIKKQEANTIGIGGANIASQALSLGLIDEVYQFIFPVMIGAGKKWLECKETTYFDQVESLDFMNGVVMLHYKVLGRRKPQRTGTIR